MTAPDSATKLDNAGHGLAGAPGYLPNESTAAASGDGEASQRSRGRDDSSLTPYYQDSHVTIYNGNCYDLLWAIPREAALITDPSYGIKWKPRVNHQDQVWNDDKPSWLAPFLWNRRICIWGGNYFTDQLPYSEAWLIWQKRPAGMFEDDDRTYAPLEMAWTNFGGKPRIKTIVWDGGLRAGERENRTFCHPAQKPVELMRWCIGLSGAQTIADPFMGSGTTLRAAKDMGVQAVGIEIEERYCEIAAKRLEQEVLNFTPTVADTQPTLAACARGSRSETAQADNK